MTLAVYRFVRTLEAPALEAMATLAAVVEAAGNDRPGLALLALDMAAFERQVRTEGPSPTLPVPLAAPQASPYRPAG